MGGGGFCRGSRRGRESAGERNPGRRPPRARPRGVRAGQRRPADSRRVRRRDRCRDRGRGAHGRGRDRERARGGAGVASGAARIDRARAPGDRDAHSRRGGQAERAAGAADVGRSVDRLQLLGTDLIDLGRIESGELVVRAEDVPFADVLEAALGETCVEPQRVESDVAPGLPLVRADASLLRRALVEALARGYGRVAVERARENRRGRGLAGSRRSHHRSQEGRRSRRGRTRGPGCRDLRGSGLRARDGWAYRGRRDTGWRFDARFAFPCADPTERDFPHVLRQPSGVVRSFGCRVVVRSRASQLQRPRSSRG